MKKVFSILFIVLLIIGLSPLSVFAWSPETPWEIPEDAQNLDYYMKLYYVDEYRVTWNTKDVRYNYIMVFSDDIDVEMHVLNDSVSLSNADNIIKAFKNGVEFDSSQNKFVFISEPEHLPGLTTQELADAFISTYIYENRDYGAVSTQNELMILDTNMNIWYEDAIVLSSDDFGPPGIEEDPLGYIEIQYDDINISNSSVNVTVKYLYNPTQHGYTSRNWDFDLDSSNGNVQVISHQGIASYWDAMGYSEGYLIYKISGLPIGITEINAYLYTGDGELMYSDIGFITRTAFVDADGDGFDDITGMPADGTGTPDIIEDNIFDMPTRSAYDDGIIGSISYGLDLLIYYITIPFKWIGEAITSLTEWLAQSMTWIENISKFFNAIFGFLPTDFQGLIYVMVLMTVVFSMFKLMRG